MSYSDIRCRSIYSITILTVVVEHSETIIADQNETKQVRKIFLTNKISATLIIPIELARRHGLNEPSHVVVEERPDGILIRKLKIDF